MSISDINFTTTKIEMIKSGQIIGSASGFFFKDNDIKYLATNRHVVINENEKHFPDALRITLHNGRIDLTQNKTVDIDLYLDSKPLWLQHNNYSNNSCDVVLIPLDISTLKDAELEKFNSSAITFIKSDIINTREVNSFGDVVVVGYPLGFHDTIHNLPIYRKAMIASCYGIDFIGQPYFLIDTNLHPGTSGSPVLSSPHTLFKEGNRTEGYALFGIHSAEHVFGDKPLGLNVVWYSYLLIEIARQSR